MASEMLEAIRKLGNGTDMAGDYEVLRVVIAYPPCSTQSVLKRVPQEPLGHPVAAVDIQKLVSIHSSWRRTIASLVGQRVVTEGQKGRRETVESVPNFDAKNESLSGSPQ
jgi:hypothetical protein